MKWRNAAVIFLAALSMTACSSEKKEVKAVCSTFFEAYAKGDTQALQAAFGESFGSAEPGELELALAKHLIITLENPETEEDTASMPAVITNVDIDAVLHMLPDETDSVEAAREELLRLFERDDLPTKEFQVELQLVRNGEDWNMVLTPELSNALLGGFGTIAAEMMEDLGV